MKEKTQQDLSTKNRYLLKGKDLIFIGVYTAIYFVVNMLFMLISGLHPVIWILLPAFIALFSGIPFMLMCAKVQKPGAVFIMGVVVGLIFFVTGMFTWMILVSFIIACALSELVRFLTKYDKFWGNTGAFMLYSLGMVGSPLPAWAMKETFMEQLVSQNMPTEYIATLESLISPGMLVVLFVAPLVCALIGALITKFMFKKHFEKAGIV